MKSLIPSSTTVKKARQEIGRATSQSDRAEQIRMLNLIRSYIYANQQALGLDLSLTFCAVVERFCHECPPCANRPTYRGFRLPQRFRSLAAVSIRDEHVPVHSYWRLPYDNSSGFANDFSTKIFDNGYAALERDFDGCNPSAIRFVAEDCSDTPQAMAITGTTYEDRQETFHYLVTKEAQMTGEVFKQIADVRFCDGVVGRVILSLPDGGRELARYNCGDVAPKFREYRLVDGCTPKQMILTANMAYQDVYDDCDLVEISNPLVWQTMARFMLLFNKSDANGNDRANMASYVQAAVGLMTEQAAVDQGEAIEFRFRRAPVTSGRLNQERRGAARW